jgi:hypothetical protein
MPFTVCDVTVIHLQRLNEEPGPPPDIHDTLHPTYAIRRRIEINDVSPLRIIPAREMPGGVSPFQVIGQFIDDMAIHHPTQVNLCACRLTACLFYYELIN